jgi:tocopherol O-methyltransferase
MDSKISWDENSHEFKVAKFYQHGVENFDDFHGGYLNFGFWENGNKDYLIAAETLVKKLGTMLCLHEDSHLLDVACGMGGQDVVLAQNFPLKKITAFDLMFEHLNHAKKRIEKAGLTDKIHTLQGSATNLPFNSETFTHVLSIEGIVHFNTREKFFNECHRVLKDNGRVVFSDYVAKKVPSNFVETFILKLVSRVWNIPFENVDTVERYKEKLERAGFRDVKIHCVGEKVIPGYCEEQNSEECIQELVRIRGWFAGRIGHVIDHILEWSWNKGLIDYVLVEANKK